MPLVSEALHNFLHARKTPANADLVGHWSIAMETQLNVIVGDGEPVAGKKSTWSNGSDTWHSIRIPKNAATDATWEDYKIGYPFDLYAEGIGMTGFDWKARRSRHFGYDFDALTGHAKGIGVSDQDLQRVKEAACALPYVEVRRSTGGGGIHLYVYLNDEGVPTENHTEHAALARCILGMMSAEVGFDFASQIDACGHVMWIWHRKMSAENHGLEIIKPATKRLGMADMPANWRDHIEVVRGRRTKVRINALAEDDTDPFEALASSRTIIPLDDSHKAQIEALMRSGATTVWVATTTSCRPIPRPSAICWKAPRARPLSSSAFSRRSPRAVTPARPTASSSRCPMEHGKYIAFPLACMRPTPGPRMEQGGRHAASTANPT
jgi:hypothetical protein